MVGNSRLNAEARCQSNQLERNTIIRVLIIIEPPTDSCMDKLDPRAVIPLPSWDQHKQQALSARMRREKRSDTMRQCVDSTIRNGTVVGHKAQCNNPCL